MEQVQLRVEAFEYLQLPFVIKEGSVGRLKLQVRSRERLVEAAAHNKPWPPCIMS